MLIITQDAVAAVNHSAVNMYYYKKTTAEDTDTGLTREVYAVAAVVRDEDAPFVLGFYDTLAEAQNAFSQLIASVSADSKAGFVMPD